MVKRLAWGCAALLAIAATANLSTSRADALKRMGMASKRIQSVHLIGWACELKPEIAHSVDQGNVHGFAEAMPRRIEAWIKDGRWREDRDREVTVYQAGHVWRNGVLQTLEKSPPLLSAFAFRAITGETPFGVGSEYTLQDQGMTTLEGRTVKKLMVESPGADQPEGVTPAPERRIFWVDPDTYLPVRMEAQRWESYRWGLDAVINYEYNLAVAETTFDKGKRWAETNKLLAPVPSAQDLYRLTDKQYADYKLLLLKYAEQQNKVKSDPTLTSAQKDAQLVSLGKILNTEIGKILNSDQRKLFNDWIRVQEEMGFKLQTPQQRKESADWRARQRAIFDAWINTQDERTRKLLRGSENF